jgi:hypothetical protein
MKNVFLSFFLLTLLSLATGCGEGKSGIIVRVKTDTAGIAPIEKPHRAAEGDDPIDPFPDRNLTPSSFTIAFTRFRLFEAREDQDTETPTRSYTVFERDSSDPIEISLTSGQTVEVEENNKDPRRGTYDRIEYGVRYFEMTIPLCETNDDCEDRRVRVYVSPQPDPNLNFTPQVGDILISGSRTGEDFSWISTSVGLPLSVGLFPITGPRPADAYQLPTHIFPPAGATNPAIFPHTLSTPLEVDSDPEKVFVFTLNLDLSGLFFFDNTDEGSTDTATDPHFNARIEDPTDPLSRDGKIENRCTDDPTCTADFWPGLPVVTVTQTEEERDD